jgi:hypothetical protein
MTDITNRDDIIDTRDIIARIEEIEPAVAAALGIDNDDEPAKFAEAVASADDNGEARELQTLYALMADLCGNGGDEQWRGDWYPLTLIRDSYFVTAMQELCADIGDLPQDLPGYLVIDWEATSENLKVDYTSVDFAGVTYWVR